MAELPYYGMPDDAQHRLALGLRRHLEGDTELLTLLVKDRCNRGDGADKITQWLAESLSDLQSATQKLRCALSHMSLWELRAEVERTAPTRYEPPAVAVNETPLLQPR